MHQRRERTFGAEAPLGEAPPAANPGVGTSDLGDGRAVILVQLQDHDARNRRKGRLRKWGVCAGKREDGGRKRAA